jgi:U4/U6.U5 tri-snRNP-associated protein 1
MKLNMNLDIAGSATAEEWVKGSRIKEKDSKAEAKRLAELKQKQLDDEDEEMAEQSSRYNASHLKGLKVMHAVNDFEEGQDVILTLKDTGILELDEDGKAIGLNEEGDELENVNLADKDRRLERENKKRRLNQPIYSALDDYEFQDGKATGTRAPMLPQYEREKKASAKFELGDGGVANHDPAAYAAVRAEASAARVQSLLTSSKEASDYYSAKEFTAFSKSKKGRDKKNKAYRKKEDDGEEVQADASLADSGAIESKAMDVEDGAPVKTAPKPLAPIKFKSLDLDEDDPDLAQALARSRRLALQTRVKDDEVALGTEDRGAIIARALAAKSEVSTPPASPMSPLSVVLLSISYFLLFVLVMQPVRNANHAGTEDDDNINVDGRRDDGTLVFNSTTEFSTRLQAHLNEKARAKTEALMRGLERDSSAAPASGSKRPHAHDMAVEDVEDDESDASQERKTVEKADADISGTMEDFAGVSDMEGSDMEVDDDDEDGEGEEGDDQLGFVHRQPLVGKGMAATLALLKGSGELKKVEQLAGRAKDSRQYDPSATDHGIKLEYRDEFGRKLTQKEAFRQLSYKFHGYGPSQKKKEKRLKVSTFSACAMLFCCAAGLGEISCRHADPDLC